MFGFGGVMRNHSPHSTTEALFFSCTTRSSSVKKGKVDAMLFGNTEHAKVGTLQVITLRHYHVNR